jgi:phosphate-selective porin OprO/OprP
MVKVRVRLCAALIGAALLTFPWMTTRTLAQQPWDAPEVAEDEPDASDAEAAWNDEPLGRRTYSPRQYGASSYSAARDRNPRAGEAAAATGHRRLGAGVAPLASGPLDGGMAGRRPPPTQAARGRATETAATDEEFDSRAYLSAEDGRAPVFSAALQESEIPPPPVDAQVFELNQRLMDLQNQINALKAQGGPEAPEPGRLRTTDVPRVEDKPPAFPKIKLTGFFQADAGWFAQDTNSLAEFGNIPDSAGFRRTRLAATGDVTEYVSYIIEMDFAQAGRPSFQDVWLDVHQLPVLGNVRVGQWRQPFGMTELTSVRELTFLERPSLFAFAPFRQIGAGFHDNNEAETMTWATSVYRFATDGFGDVVGDRGYGLASRITALPIYADDGQCVLHVGFDHSFNNPNSGTITYRNTPEFAGVFTGPLGNLGSVPTFVNTGAIAANHSNLFNAELAGVYGSFHFQSELRYAVVSQATGGTAVFPGFYAQGAYLLTGEVRPYNKKAGVLGRIKPLRPFSWYGPDCGPGAWEIATRWSYIDLNSDGITGNRMNDLTVGVNWYLNQFTKFQFNYIHSWLDSATFDRSNTDIVAMRAQLDF